MSNRLNAWSKKDATSKALWVAGVLLVILIPVMIAAPWVRGWTEYHEGTVSAVGTIVAAIVGLVTLATLRHAIDLSEDENERQKDALRPVLIITLSLKVAPELDLFLISMKNGGAGPALDVTWRWSDLKLNFDNDGPPKLSMAGGDRFDWQFAARRRQPFPAEVSMLSWTEEGHPTPDFYRNCITVANLIDIVGTAHLEYSDVFGRRFGSSLTIGTVRHGAPLRWPGVEQRETTAGVPL